MQYQRHLSASLSTHFDKYKQALVLLGARQTGKTTLLKQIFPQALYLLADNEQTLRVLETYDINTYKPIIGRHKQLIIDELHLLSNPGRAVKIIYDQIPNLQLIVTGSSALHIKNKTSESMAGRKIEYQMFPLTFAEYLVQKGVEQELNHNILTNILEGRSAQTRLFNPAQILDQVLLYGLYPELLNLSQHQDYLLELADSAIFKDIVELNLISDRAKAKELLRLLAYQIGNLINYAEIASTLSMDRRTVERYIDIFEQSYFIFRVYPFAKNKRKEIGKTAKIFFHDLGLRNAIINNFDPSPLRPDRGAMFENFIIAELFKHNAYKKAGLHINYWRLKSGAEVDLVLSDHSDMHAVEIKSKKGQLTSVFTKHYPQAKTHLVTQSNFY
jgi:predicted AAA+ superfamily ATPase